MLLRLVNQLESERVSVLSIKNSSFFQVMSPKWTWRFSFGTGVAIGKCGLALTGAYRAEMHEK